MLASGRAAAGSAVGAIALWLAIPDTQAELLERHLVSSQHNEAKASADRPPAVPGAVAGPGPANSGPANSDPANSDPANSDPARPGSVGSRRPASNPPASNPPASNPPGSNPPGPNPQGPNPPGYASQPPSGPAAFGGPLPGNRTPWKEGSDGRTVFRRVAPVVLWWTWVIFLLFNMIQVIIPDHDYFSVEFAVGLLAVTGLVYAAALRPRVLATADGLEVRNPVRDHLINWGALNGVYLGDAVELSCARPEPRKDKSIFCWALYSGRRSRIKSEQIGMRSWTRTSHRVASAGEPAVHDPSHLMAAELGRRSTKAREEGAPAATLESRWAWRPIAAILVPAAALLALLLAK